MSITTEVKFQVHELTCPVSLYTCICTETTKSSTEQNSTLLQTLNKLQHQLLMSIFFSNCTEQPHLSARSVST